jgi:hypothetical protein
MQTACMPSLQIRDLPDDLYQRIAAAAKAEHRSLAQQATVELQRALCGDQPDRRTALVARLRAEQRRLDVGAPGPESLIRDDRDTR